jgi:hypothetical protein
MWHEFRKVPNFNEVVFEVAHTLIIIIAGIMFVELLKLHYIVMNRIIDMNEADILARRAKSLSAKHSMMYEMARMTEEYIQAWQKFDF